LSRDVRRAALGRDTLAIAFEPCSSFHGLPQVTRKLMRSLPNLRLELYEMPVTEHAHRLRAGQIDLAYAHRGEEGEGIQFTPLVSEPLLIGLPSSQPYPRRGRIVISDLDESFIFWSRSIAPACYDYIVEVIRSQGVEAKIKHVAPDHGKLLEMVAAGLGWTVAPACADRSRYPGVRFCKIQGIETKVEFGLTHLSARQAELRKVIGAWKQLAG